MTLVMEHRLDRLRARLAELLQWRVVETMRDRRLDLRWPADRGRRPWPTAEGVVHFAASAEAPSDWPLEDIRLSLDAGGESLVEVRYPDGTRDHFGLDPNHEEFRLKHRAVTLAIESVARRQFGQPVRDPRLSRAALLRIDRPVELLHLLVTQIIEVAQALGDDEAAPPMVEAAEVALRSLDWPSHTPDYIARIAQLAHVADDLAAAGGRPRPAGPRRLCPRQRRGAPTTSSSRRCASCSAAIRRAARCC